MQTTEERLASELRRGEPASERARAPLAPRPPLRLSACMPVPEALSELTRVGEAIALVTHRGVDVGVVTAQDLTGEGSIEPMLVRDMMTREVVHISPATELRETLRTYQEAAWASAIRRRPGR